jgi:hypothetical protein
MSRESTPERVEAAHRAAILARLIGDGAVIGAEDWIAR